MALKEPNALRRGKDIPRHTDLPEEPEQGENEVLELIAKIIVELIMEDDGE